MQTKTNVKAGVAIPNFIDMKMRLNHNQASAALKVRSNVKAGDPVIARSNLGLGVRTR